MKRIHFEDKVIIFESDSSIAFTIASIDSLEPLAEFSVEDSMALVGGLLKQSSIPTKHVKLFEDYYKEGNRE